MRSFFGPPVASIAAQAEFSPEHDSSFQTWFQRRGSAIKSAGVLHLAGSRGMATPTSAPPTQQPAVAAAQAPPEFDIAKWATFTAPPACAACQQKMQLQKPRQGPCVAVCTAAECPAKDQPLLPTAHAVHAGIAKLTAPAGHRSQAGAMAQRCKEAVDQTVADAEQLQLQLRRNSTKTDVPTNNATSAGGESAKKKRKKTISSNIICICVCC